MVLVANGLTMSQQCALVAQKGGCSSLLLSHCRPPQFQAGWKLLMRASGVLWRWWGLGAPPDRDRLGALGLYTWGRDG